jgi:hypothetical protein
VKQGVPRDSPSEDATCLCRYAAGQSEKDKCDPGGLTTGKMAASTSKNVLNAEFIQVLQPAALPKRAE